MQAPANRQSFRGVQRNPRPGTAAFMQGKKQAALALQRYHILCAAIQGKYVVRDIEPIEHAHNPLSSGQKFARGTIDFSAYKEFKLHPIENVELPEAEDGHFNIVAYVLFPRTISSDWRMREGGVLYTLGEYGEFFNCMIGYHKPNKKTNIAEWDTLFEKLENSGYRKNIIPCMFFGQRDGCLDRNCPFLHDREAVLADRNQILQDRRQRLSHTKRSPTTRQHLNRYHGVLDAVAGNDETLRAEIEGSKQVDEMLAGDRAYCTNQRCMKPWKQGEPRKPLKRCTGCKIAMYCSPECQKQDWPRHKKDPCAPIDDQIENDELWNSIGTRKGTSWYFKSHKDIAKGTLHVDA